MTEMGTIRAGATETDASVILAEIWRGPVLEHVHRGAVAVCRPNGELVAGWGDTGRVMLPRSSCKMIQALPLIETGAADRTGLGTRQIALAAASHQGTELHTRLARDWLAGLGLGDDDLRCGAHPPLDRATRAGMRERGETPCQVHNNCSGKHCGFLTVTRHLGAAAEYVEPDHPLQRMIRTATEEVCGESVGGFAIDGCSAPNFAVTLKGLATAMARFAAPEAAFDGARASAARRIREAMVAHPELVAGEGRPVTRLIRATGGRAVVKTGGTDVFVAILPEQGLGIAIKADDSSMCGAEAALAALLVRHGVLDRDDPLYGELADHPQTNWRGLVTGRLRVAETLFA